MHLSLMELQIFFYKEGSLTQRTNNVSYAFVTDQVIFEFGSCFVQSGALIALVPFLIGMALLMNYQTGGVNEALAADVTHVCLFFGMNAIFMHFEIV